MPGGWRRIGASASGSLLGMAAGLILDLGISYALGAGSDSDRLFLILSVILFGDVLIRQSSRFALLPQVAAAMAGEEAPDVLGGLWSFAVCAGLGVGLVCGAVLASIVPIDVSAAPGLAVTWLIPPVLMASSGSIAVIGAILECRDRFLLSQSRAVFLYGPTIPLLAMSDPIDLWWKVPAGMTFGYVGLAVVLFVLTPSPSRPSPTLVAVGQIRPTIRSIGIVGAGFAMVQAMRVVERAVAGAIVPGGLTVFYLAFRILSAGQTLGGLSIASAALPRLSALRAKGDIAGFWRSVRQSLLLIQAIAWGSIILIEASVWLVGAYAPTVTLGALELLPILQLLAVLCLALPAFSSLPLLNGISLTDMRSAAVFVGMTGFAASQLLLLVLLGPLLGLEGVAGSLVASAWVSALFVGAVVVAMRRQDGGAVPRG